MLRCDGGPELISHALKEFAEENIGSHHIPPGQPWRIGHFASDGAEQVAQLEQQALMPSTGSGLDQQAIVNGNDYSSGVT